MKDQVKVQPPSFLVARASATAQIDVTSDQWHYLVHAGQLRCPRITVPCACSARALFDGVLLRPDQRYHQVILHCQRYRYPSGVIDWYWFGQCLACKKVYWTQLLGAEQSGDECQPDAVVG